MKKKILYCLIIAALGGCENHLTYSYLMTHPQALKEAVNRCDETHDTSRECEIVMNAALEFSALVEEEQANPEKFGEKIMTAQNECVAAQQTKETSADEKCQRVKVLQAVMSLSSPE